MAYAFRCNNCGRLEEGSHAGERDVPLGCRVCGKGSHFELNDGAPTLVADPDNWTVLADLPKDELAPILEHHAIGKEEIGRHEPTPAAPSDQPPQILERSVEDGVDAKDVVS